jgi:Obg family GTPase CgtA
MPGVLARRILALRRPHQLQERRLRLELKLLADVGLLGFPNVGKSSLIARISAARPRIAAYPFTTLVPNLGVVSLPGERSFVAADVPGLIEGAHRGAGLGHRFLRHLERTRVLVHLLEVSPDPQRSPPADHAALRRELSLYDEALAGRPEIVVLNKIDLSETRARLPALERAFRRRGIALQAVSAATGEGLRPLLEKAWQALHPRGGRADEREGDGAREGAKLPRGADVREGAKARQGAEARQGAGPRRGAKVQRSRSALRAGRGASRTTKKPRA